jgi:hypothetical protein
VRNTGSGVVYILANDSMPGLLKIGFTTTTAKARAHELSQHSGVPTPFLVLWSSDRVDRPEHLEKHAHGRLREYREQYNREFFRVDAAVAIATIEVLVEKLHVAGEARRVAPPTSPPPKDPAWSRDPNKPLTPEELAEFRKNDWPEWAYQVFMYALVFGGVWYINAVTHR